MNFRDSSMIWTLYPFRWRMGDKGHVSKTKTERPYLSLCSSPVPNAPSGLSSLPRGALGQLVQP